MKNTILSLSLILLGSLANGFAALPPIYDHITDENRYGAIEYSDRTDTAKSDIKITYPNSRTTWALPRFAKIDWETANIDPEKKIRFYLVKDDVVVQDLGIFQNSKTKDSIRLDRGLATGNNYRVMGIEQNPADKFHIAKYSTPFFTIIKAPRKKKEAKVLKKAPVATAKIESSPEVAKEDAPKLRHSFDGRSISYNKVLEVESSTLVISLWDHGRTDGDIVSIYLNGEAVVYKHTLTYKKKIYEINLKSGIPNDLFLYAHNLGRFAPNTVAIEIVDGNKSENIVLNSDLQSCEAVVIKVKE
ncbi:MAG: hypothetical protein KJN76_14360 [Eudoraea sp.]|nr:hypothetical protein [Eudoraea sp.]